MTSLPIDLHLELSNLRNFVNDQINSENPYSIDGKEFYEILKRVVIDAEVKPFLTFPKDESEINYYEKYRRQSQEVFNKLIPDFFEYEGEFYDLDRVQYAHKDFIRAEDFERLFIIKLLELKSNNYPLREFLTFQQFDSFYGQKESIDSFLYQLTEKDSNCHLLQDLCQELKNWIEIENLNELKNESIEDIFSKTVDIPQQENSSPKKSINQIEALKGKELESRWNIEQIKHYFSFLYKEKSENGMPFLKKEEFDKIFENGLRIPETDINPLFQLNCSKRFPVKIIHFAIYQFNENAGFRRRHKKDYFLFFASYLKELSKIKYSPKDYESLSKNVSNYESPLSTIDWSIYLHN